MWIVFYEIPGLLLLSIALFLLGFGYAIAPMVLYLIVLMPILGYWGVHFKIRKGSILGKIVSVLGMISALYVASIFCSSTQRIQSLLIMIAVMAVLHAVLNWIVPKKINSPVNVFFMTAFLVFSVMWSIGCEMDKVTKVSYQNLAYYQYQNVKTFYTKNQISPKAKYNGVPLNGKIYDMKETSVFKISDDHVLETFQKGDMLKPNLSEQQSKFSSIWDAYDDITWYPVYTRTGQAGYIPDTGISQVYYHNSPYVKNSMQHKKEKWYAFLPNSAIYLCETVYEKIPILDKLYLTQI